MHRNRIFTGVLFSLLLLLSCSPPPTTRAPSGKAPKAGPDGITTGLQRAAAKPLYNLEKIGDIVNPFEKQPVVVLASGMLSLGGWAVDGANQDAAGGVEVMIDGKSYRAQSGQDRADVAEHFKVPAYLKAGFSFTAPAAAFGPGRHELAIRVISHDGKTYSEGLGLAIEVR